MTSNITIQQILDDCEAKLYSNIKVNIRNNIQEFAPIKFILTKINQEAVDSIYSLMSDNLKREDFEYKKHNFVNGFITKMSNYGDFIIEINFDYTKVDNLYLVGGHKEREIIYKQKGKMYFVDPNTLWNGYLEYAFEEPLLVHLQV